MPKLVPCLITLSADDGRMSQAQHPRKFRQNQTVSALPRLVLLIAAVGAVIYRIGAGRLFDNPAKLVPRSHGFTGLALGLGFLLIYGLVVAWRVKDAAKKGEALPAASMVLRAIIYLGVALSAILVLSLLWLLREVF